MIVFFVFFNKFIYIFNAILIIRYNYLSNNFMFILSIIIKIYLVIKIYLLSIFWIKDISKARL